jgi:PBSX family phage terminase large subunit
MKTFYHLTTQNTLRSIPHKPFTFNNFYATLNQKKGIMSSDQILSDKQLEFILKSTAKWNLAHGSVRTGKTVGTLFRFMQAAYECPDSQIFMIGHTIETIYQNCVRLLLESPQLACFKPFCTYFPGKKQLAFHDKMISLLSAKDEGAISAIQGKTMSVVYCDEMALYPESIIDMIDTRLSNPYSIGFASMNPSHPDHKLKQWIDKAENGDKNYYALHFTLDDNPFVSEDYKARIRDSLSGVFYKRNYLGLWCLAEGAIYDFFERDIHTVERPPTAAEYFIVGIDYGTVNAFCALIIGVNSGRATQTAKRIWVEKEYYWDSKTKGRQKTNLEYAEDLKDFLDPYPIKYIYLDPSAEAFQVELRRKGFTVIHAKNDVLSGIQTVSNLMKEGQLTILKSCTNTIREIQGYVWDPKLSARGYDEPLKKADHACDALRYAVHSHRFTTFDAEEHYRKQEEKMRQQMYPNGYGFTNFR